MSVNTNRYYERKAAGVCVRCEAPRCGSSVLCEAHLNYSRSRRKAKAPDDAPWAITSSVEPPRAEYKSESIVMPPIPDKCPRCSGFVLTQHGETRCLICAWYLQPIMPPIPEEHRGNKTQHGKTGPQLPVVVRV